MESLRKIKDMKDAEILVTLKRSVIGGTPSQRKTAVALGLRKTGSQRIHKVNDSIYGMLKTIEHLITVVPVEKK